MGTEYYKLKPPVTSVKVVEENPSHTKLSIWINHGLAGTLTLRTKEVQNLLRILADDGMCVLHTRWGGLERGTVVTVNDTSLPEDTVIVSEYGRLSTISEIRARDGATRGDGLPTELFGYGD